MPLIRLAKILHLLDMVAIFKYSLWKVLEDGDMADRKMAWNGRAGGSLRIAVVDDDERVRSAIKCAFELGGNILCAGEYADGWEAASAIPKLNIDGVIMDISMPKMSGIESTRHIKAVRPELPVLMYTARQDFESFFCSLVVGCDGYLMKDVAPDRLPLALRSIIAGGLAWSDPLIKELLRCFRGLANSKPERNHCSPQEIKIASYLFQNYRHKEIASALGVTLKTVQNQVYRMEKRFKAHNRGELIQRFLEIEPDMAIPAIKRNGDSG